MKALHTQLSKQTIFQNEMWGSLTHCFNSWIYPHHQALHHRTTSLLQLREWPKEEFLVSSRSSWSLLTRLINSLTFHRPLLSRYMVLSLPFSMSSGRENKLSLESIPNYAFSLIRNSLVMHKLGPNCRNNLARNNKLKLLDKTSKLYILLRLVHIPTLRPSMKPL